jgi:hypothetical protein
MSEASAHKMSYVEESVRGTTPTNPLFRALPDTRTTLALTRDTLTTERITGDRFPAEPRAGAKGVSGDIPADLSTRAYDDFIASALQGAWVESGGTDEITLEVGGVPQANTVVGDSFATTNGDVHVDEINAKTGEEKTVLRYEPTITGPAVYYEIFGLGTATIDSETFEVTLYTDAAEDATVKAGDTRKSFSILREFSDFEAGEKPFLLYKGCEVASWNLAAAANGLAKSNFTFWGRDMVGPSETAPANSSVAPAYETEPFDTFSGQLDIDGVESCIVTDYSVTINNGHAPRYVVGCDVSEDASVAQSIIEGSITAYFNDAVLYEKFVNETSFSMTLTLEDSGGNQMVVTMPNLKVLSGTQPDVTEDGPVTIVVNFSAHKDETLGSHISVQRVYPLAV